MHPLLNDVYRSATIKLVAFFRAAERKGRCGPALYLFNRFLEEATASKIHDESDQKRFFDLLKKEFALELSAIKQRAAEEDAKWRAVFDQFGQTAITPPQKPKGAKPRQRASRSQP